MQLSLTCYRLGVTISFCKFLFESGTLIQVRYCHLFSIWYVLIVDMLFSSFFNGLSIVRNVTPFKVFLTIYMHQFGWLLGRGGYFLNLLQKEGGGGSNPEGNSSKPFV